MSAFNDLFSSKIKIIQVLRRADGPLIMQHVAKRSHMSVQLVSYHLEQMVEWGIIVASTDEEKTVYRLQEAYYDNNLLEELSEMLVPYMNDMREGMDFSQIKVQPTEAVIRNLFMFMRLFQTEIEKLPFDKKDNIKDVFIKNDLRLP